MLFGTLVSVVTLIIVIGLVQTGSLARLAMG
jgi:hypothetical protein